VAEHESALERDFVTLASFLDANASITAQPLTLRFPHEARLHRYTPDFLVRWSDGARELVEVKYQADLNANEERLRPGFDAARRWARENGAVFRTATEVDIRGPVLENAKRLLPLRRVPVDRKAAERVFFTVQSVTKPTFRLVVEALPENQSVILATVWRLIARGSLRVDLSTPISLDTQLTLP
jgi:hypothetical protein